MGQNQVPKPSLLEDYVVSPLLKKRAPQLHRLLQARHATKAATVARYAEKIETDAWMVLAGPQPVLEWFAAQSVPVMGMFGRMSEVPKLAGLVPRKIPALKELVQRLAALGHRRMVLLVREERRLPQPGVVERRFLELLGEQGVKTGPYNLPDWEENAEGLCRCLDALFAHTPPTLLILDEAAPFITARLHLAQRGLVTPRDVSMICLNPDPVFEWSNPSVSHVDWDSGAMIRRVLQWADNVARGREDHGKTLLEARFHEGGTIGPAPVTQGER
jgi:DNA-binding LacI/PurR family transcriptional regulator